MVRFISLVILEIAKWLTMTFAISLLSWLSLDIIVVDSRRWPSQPLCWNRKEEPQAQATRTVAQLVLHGCQVPRYAHTRLLRQVIAALRLFYPIGCFAITTVFSHAQTVVLCGACSSVLCQPTGGKARLTEGTHPLFNAALRRLRMTNTRYRKLIPTEELGFPSWSPFIILHCTLVFASLSVTPVRVFSHG